MSITRTPLGFFDASGAFVIANVVDANISRTLHGPTLGERPPAPPLQLGGIPMRPVIQLAYAASIITDVSEGTTFQIAPLTGPLALANPINPLDGQVVLWIFQQDGTGSRVVTLGSKFMLPSSATDPLGWSTAANAVDVLAAKYRADIAKWMIVSFVPGYANA